MILDDDVDAGPAASEAGARTAFDLLVQYATSIELPYIERLRDAAAAERQQAMVAERKRLRIDLEAHGIAVARSAPIADLRALAAAHLPAAADSHIASVFAAATPLSINIPERAA